jgi:hypothetical protein
MLRSALLLLTLVVLTRGLSIPERIPSSGTIWDDVWSSLVAGELSLVSVLSNETSSKVAIFPN